MKPHRKRCPKADPFGLAMLPLLWLAAAASAADADPAPPVVAAFDRFHSDAPATDDSQPPGGRLLLTELGCTACHASGALPPKPGPRLDGAGHRLQRPWLVRYLLDPAAVKPGATMPGMLQQLPPEQRRPAAEALAAYLTEQDPPEPKLQSTAANPIAPEFWRKGNQARGGRLYHRIGCVACHDSDEQYAPENVVPTELQQKIERLELSPEELEERGIRLPDPVASIPLGDLAAKHTRRSLAMFLIAPHLIRAGERMPDFQLSPDQAADLTAYLMRSGPNPPAGTQPTPTAASDAALKDRGRELFRSLRCANCHQHRGAEPQAAAPLAELNAERPGCLSGADNTPHYPLSVAQTAALNAAIATLPSDDAPLDEAAALRMTMEQLNCHACHQREARGGVGPRRWQFFENAPRVDLGDEGRLPPKLDGVGRKLTPAWLARVLKGEGAVRPYFLARMPAFPSHAASLAEALRRADEPQASPSSRPPLDLTRPDAQLLAAGAELIGQGCIRCHPLHGNQLPGAIGIDIGDLDARLQLGWFREFLRDPNQVKPGTRMPTFFPNGRSVAPQLLDGDVDRQIDAIWAYLNTPGQPLPEVLERGKQHNFELTVDDRPVVLRTFMERAGTHAIAVGFPQQRHFAFDADSVRLAQLWSGRFLNAHGTWFDRFTPPAKPLGDRVVRLPARALVGRGESLADIKPPKLHFQGYRLDSQRVPTFLYRVGELRVEERVAPDGEGLRRRLTVASASKDSGPQTLWFAVADSVRAVEGREAQMDSGARARIDGDAAEKGRVVEEAGRSQWLVPLELRDGRGQLEVLYVW